MCFPPSKGMRDGETCPEILPESKIVAEIVPDAETRRNIAREKKRVDDRERMRILLADPVKRAEIMRRKAERRAVDASIRGREYAKRKEERAARAEPRKKAAEIQASFDAEIERMAARKARKKKPVGLLPLFEFGRKERERKRFSIKYANDAEFKAKNIAKIVKWKALNPDKVNAWSKTDKAREWQKAWRSGPGKESCREAMRRRGKKPEYRIIGGIRRRMRQMVKDCRNGVKGMRTRKAVGCSNDFLKEYLESMFKPGMSWINYGEWHVDHLIPLAFAKGSPSVAMSLNHWTNLRPLWAKENMEKGDSMDYDSAMRIRT